LLRKPKIAKRTIATTNDALKIRANMRMPVTLAVNRGGPEKLRSKCEGEATLV